MDLREVKKEIESLLEPKILAGQIEKAVEMAAPSKKRAFSKEFSSLRKSLQEIKSLETSSFYDLHYHLTALGTAQLLEDSRKVKFLSHKIVKDTTFGISALIKETKLLQEQTNQLQQSFSKLAPHLAQGMDLESSLLFTESNPGNKISQLRESSKKRVQILQHLGKHFVALIRKKK